MFAVACKHVVEMSAVAPHKVPLPCSECTRVLSSKDFKDALRKPKPEEKNYIYTNHQFRSPLLGQIYARSIGLKELIETPVSFCYFLQRQLLKFQILFLQDAKRTPCICYAQGVLTGKYDNNMFHGLMEAIVTKYDREERGVGMQNFRYAPAWDEMCHILKIHSQRVYEALSAYLPARSACNFWFAILFFYP